MIYLDKENFDKEVIQSKGKILVDFYADWCGPCQGLAPIIEEIDEENKNENIKICKLNVDNNQEISRKYKVMSIPTILVFEDGEIIKSSVGLVEKEYILSMLK
ncbi:thioredoxin [uncultured Finegoldia sp.]|uniref:thioredoxin n=1 Tax=uncultured Finegoldia sp. TaxID=328009 RepID=UPI002619A3BE|nr:thioredoxin [uncultured Finegoldia sp.]